jgi:MFS family permease
MYISTLRAPLARVPVNVLAIGAVSLVTDVSSEMVSAALPLYLVAALGLSPLAFGVLDGLHSGLTALLRLVGGHLGDRWQRRKAIAGLGYALSAVSRLGLLAAGASVPGIGAAITLDRAGKGLRTAPRDSLLALSAAPDGLGAAFGVHRALDTAGALLGPLAAAGLLAATAGAYDAVFVASACIGAFGVAVLVLFVRDRRIPLAAAPTVLSQLREPAFRRLCAAAALLGAATISDGFVYLLLRRQAGLAPQYVVLLPIGTAAAFLLLAAPLGRLADRVGRRRVFLAGHLALLAVYALLLLGAGVGTSVVAGVGAGLGWSLGWPVLALLLVLALHGTFYAATDGVLAAAASAVLPAQLSGSGLAVLQTGQALARLAAAVAFGAAWTAWGPAPALAAAAVALAAGLGAVRRVSDVRGFVGAAEPSTSEARPLEPAP